MNERDRDAAVERLLREALAAEVGDNPSVCLDVDTLAAWSEGSLTASARSQAEAHASRCARCTALLATMVRTMPVAAGPATSPSPLRKWLTMLGPVVAAAAAVTLWMVVDRRVVSPPISAPSATARSSPSPTEPLGEPSVAPPEAKTAGDRPAGAPVELRKRRENEAAPPLADARGSAKGKDERDAAPPQLAPPLPAAQSLPGPSSQQAQQARDLGTAAQRAQSGALDKVAQAMPVASPPPPPPAAPAPARADAAAASTEQAKASPGFAAGGRAGGVVGGVREVAPPNRQAAIFDVPTPEPSVRWRILGRTVSKTVDAGTTWAPQYTAGDTLTLTAGVAPSATAAWIVGRAGVVLRTADGRTWQRVTFPEAVDLIAVTAPDERTATVTTADQRTFVTTDGGTTWAPRP